MPILEGAAASFIAALVYDGLKSRGKVFLGPYYKTFQKAQKKARKQLEKEFSEGELLAIFTTFNNMEWKLSFGKKAREEVNRNLIKGVEAINGQVFVDELVSELHENHRQYDIELVKKVINRFVEIVSQELRADHEILSYLQDIKLGTIEEKIDSMFRETVEGQKRIEQKLDELTARIGEPKPYEDGIPQSENLNLRRLFDQGKEHLKKYEYNRAIKAFRAALALQDLQPSESVALLIHIGIAQYDQSKWDQALGSWKEALDAAERADDEEGQAAALGNLGLVYRDKGEWDKAIEFYNKTLEIEKKIDDKHGMAKTYGNLGNVHLLKGDWKNAIKFHNESLKIEEKIGDEGDIAKTFTNLGSLYLSKGDWDEASRFYNESLQIQQKIGDEHGIGANYLGLGSVYLRKDEWHKSISFYEKSLRMAEKTGDQQRRAQSYIGLGIAYGASGERKKGIEFLSTSLEIEEKIGDEHGIAQTKANIGIFYKKQGQKDEARKSLEESLKTFEKIGDEPNAELVREHLSAMGRSRSSGEDL